MRLKLQEEPREWRKFTLVWCVVIGFVSFLVWRKQFIGSPIFHGIVVVASGAAVLSMIVPHLFRGFYRVGMTVSFHVGQLMGKVILTGVFFLVVTPMGILLRVMGKDLLELKRSNSKRSYWKDARRIGRFDQQF